MPIAIALTETICRGHRFPVSAIDETLIAVDRSQGRCYAMNATTSRIWQLLEHPTTGASICDALCREFEVDRAICEADVIGILTEMKEAGLLS